ncbi:MAG TPA: hypothetical protein VHV52_13620 [Gaiellaceae bacterium]|nr:hypothetical protein [Gaiellaceae bacterium]
MNVRRFGRLGGTPFIFWHALGPDTSGAYFEEVGEVLGRRGYDVFAVDGPGFGESPALRFEAAVPQTGVRWLEGAGHGIFDDVGPELGDEIADWLERR